jgi:intraflagellar transport protein 172
MTPETESMWKALSETALADMKLNIAEHCFAALGDVARTRYLNSLNSIIETSDEAPNKNYIVRARLAALDKQFKLAETIYVENGKVEDAMEMYQEVFFILK